MGILGERGLPSSLLNQLLGSLDRDRSIPTVGVGTDGLGEFFIKRCTTYQHDEIFSYALLDQCVDHDFHIGHGGRKQGGHSKNIGLMLLDRKSVV